MNVYNDLNNLPSFKNAVVTIGSFDGVHSGHQKILEKIKGLAKNIDGESVVVTFHPHPREIIYPKDNSLKLITTIHEKVAYFERYEIDNVVVVPFTIEFSQQKADEYIEKFLVEKFNPKFIVIGYDHRFGLNRQGDINFLKWHGKENGFEVIEIQKQEIEDIAISSTKIRGAIDKGEISVANKLLGHPYILTGTVVKGQQLGTSIGYPTANLKIPHKNKLIPADGIYAVYAYHKEIRHKGMLYIGNRPTLTEYNNKTIEVNIFNFNKDLYGDKLQIEFLEKIREDQKFNDLDGLKSQLEADKKSTLEVIEQLEAEKVIIEEKKLPAVSVVILNWNGKELLEKFLPSVFQSNYSNLEVVVVDNASSDESTKFLLRKHPKVKLIELSENHGFAKGYNLGLKQIDADYYILLNSDVEVTDDWIHPVIELMEKDKKIGAVQPKIKSQTNKDSFEYAGACGGWMDYLGYPFCRGRILSTLEKDDGQYEDIQEIFWASGAAFFIRPQLFHGLGGFDETYFAHMEEIDLCWRIKRAGFKIMVCPKSVVYHVGGSTLSYLSPRKTYLNFRNSYYTLVKNESKQKLTWLIPTRLLLDALAGCLFLIQGKVSHIISIIKAHWTFFPMFRQLYKSRSKTQDLIDKLSINNQPNRMGILNKSIIFQYYVKGKKYFHQL